MNLGGAVRINRCGLGCLIALVLLLILYSSSLHSDSGPVPVVISLEGGDPDSSLLLSSFVRSKGFSKALMLSPGKVKLKALLAASIDAAVQGGKRVVAVRQGAADLKETVKGKTREGVKDSATQGDYESHKIMYYGLRKAFPEVKVISEEHTATPDDLSEVVGADTKPSPEVEEHMPGDEVLNADDIAIWIDPLDATKEYTENLVEYVTTMVGVALRGKPILGVVHRPFSGETYWAVVGHGRSPNLLEGQGHAPPPPKAGEKVKARIIVSRSHSGNVANFSKTALVGEDVQIIPAAGAGFKVLEVILGRADVYLHVTAIKKWDLAAGVALMAAMGGEMTTLGGGEVIDFSGHSDPLNSQGLIAYVHDSPVVQKLKTIQIKE